ncbi:MAG: hypothetical protein ACRCV0_07595 [Brevinema sp.]
MNNKHNIFDTLTNRIKTIYCLYDDIEAHSYLVPEMIAKTIRDTHRYMHNGVSHQSIPDIMSELGIQCSAEENMLLKDIEISLRKSKDYSTFVEHYDREILLSIIKRFDKTLQTLAQDR